MIKGKCFEGKRFEQQEVEEQSISECRFVRLGEVLPEGAMLVFNNTKVIRARIIMH